MADKREIVTDLLARNKMTQATDGAARDLGKVGDAAEDAARDADKLTRATTEAGRGADKLGDSAGDAGNDVAKLDNEIHLAEQELRRLARAFRDTDDAAARLDISKGMRKSQAEIRRLNTAKSILSAIIPDPGDVAKAGAGVVTTLGKSISQSAATLGATMGSSPAGAAIGVALGTAAAAAIVPAMVSAVSAGTGVGALGAGIALVISKDDKVKAAGARLGKNFIDSMAKAASDSLTGPTLRSFGVLEAAGDRISARWGKAFKGLSGELVPLVTSVAAGAEKVSNSLSDAASRSGPALRALGDSILLVSDGIAGAIENVTAGGPQMANSLTLIAGVMGDLISASGTVIRVFGTISQLLPGVGPLTKHYMETAEASRQAAEAQRGMIGPMNDAEAAARGQTEAFAGLNSELKKQADPVFALADAQLKLKDAQNEAAKATKKHGENSEQARAANRKMAKAALDLQAAVGALGKDFDGKLTPAMRASLKAAGMTEKQINGVEREFGQAKKAGDRYAKTYTAQTKVTGAAAARKSLYSVKEVIDGIPRTVSIGMKITGVTNVSAAAAAIRKNTRASGGPITKGTPYWVGEEGPELILPESNGRVLSATQSRGYATKTGGGSPWQAHRNQGSLRLELAGQQEIVTMFRYLVRSANLLEGR